MTEGTTGYHASLAGTDRLARQPMLLLFMGLFATAVGQAFVFAILPPLGRSVGLDELRITAIISTSALVFTLSAPFWGRISDRVGRKPVIFCLLYTSDAADE